MSRCDFNTASYVLEFLSFDLVTLFLSLAKPEYAMLENTSHTLFGSTNQQRFNRNSRPSTRRLCWYSIWAAALQYWDILPIQKLYLLYKTIKLWARLSNKAHAVWQCDLLSNTMPTFRLKMMIVCCHLIRSNYMDKKSENAYHWQLCNKIS